MHCRGVDAVSLNGTRIGQFEVLDEIARGGMGVVYRARDVQSGCIVALKMILKGEFATPDEYQRFTNEAAAVARLVHPHIVSVITIGQHTGLPYFAMNYVAGETLAQRLSRGPLDFEVAAKLIRDLASAIHFAHEQRVVHRDLKPANILLDMSGVGHVTDFGLAKHVDQQAELTEMGLIIGTPAYMSPEQATGSSEQVGPAADTYSLGAMLYHCITGRPPFVAKTPADVIPLVRFEEPLSPRQIDRRIPRDLEVICLKCLRKDPLDRYDSALRLEQDLERFLNRLPILARPMSGWERRWEAICRHPVTSLLVTLVFLSLVLGIGVSLWFANQADIARKQALQQSLNASDSAHRSEMLASKSLESEYRASLSLAQVEHAAGDLRATRSRLESLAGKVSDVIDMEWWHLWRLAHPRTKALDSDPGLAFAWSIAPDDQYLAAGCARGVRLWKTGQQFLASIPLGNDITAAVCFSPDGQWLAAATHDGFLGIIDYRKPQVIHTWSFPDAVFTSIAVIPGPNGESTPEAVVGAVVLGDSQGHLRSITVATGATHWIQDVSSSPISSLDVNRDLGLIAVGTGWGQVQIHDAATGAFVRTIRSGGSNQSTTANTDTQQADSRENESTVSDPSSNGVQRRTPNSPAQTASREAPHIHSQQPVHVRLCPNQKEVAIATSGGTVELVDLSTGELRAVLSGHDGAIHAISRASGQSLLATAGEDSTIRVWDLNRRIEVAVLRGHDFAARSVAISAAGSFVVSSGLDSRSLVHNPLEAADHETIAVHQGPIAAFVETEYGKRFLSIGFDGVIVEHRFSVDTDQLESTPRFHGVALNNPAVAKGRRNLPCAYDPATRCIAWSNGDSTISVTVVGMGDAELLKPTILETDLPAIHALAFLRDGMLAVAGGTDKVNIINPENGQTALPPIPAKMDHVFAMATTQEDSGLVWGGTGDAVQFWRDGGNRSVEYQGVDGYVTALSVPWHSDRPVSGCWNGAVVIWQSDIADDSIKLMGHRGPVLALTQTQRGSRIISASADGTVKFWRRLSGNEVYQLSTRGIGIRAVQLLNKDQLLLIGCDDGSIRAYRCPRVDLSSYSDSAASGKSMSRFHTGHERDSSLLSGDWRRSLLSDEWEFGWTGGISNADDEVHASYVRLLDLNTDGSQLTASYDWQQGSLAGTLDGNHFYGSWKQKNGRGELELTYDPASQAATGWWNEGGNTPRRAAILRKKLTISQK